MGGWHAIISHGVENHLKLSRVTCFLVNVEYAEDIPHQWSAKATRRPYVNWDLNRAVIFFTHFESTERGQRCERKGAGSLETKASLEKWPHLNHPVSTHATTEAETELWACPARRVWGGAEVPSVGTRKCRMSTERTMWGGWGLAPECTHHAIPLPGHSTVQSTVPTL